MRDEERPQQVMSMIMVRGDRLPRWKSCGCDQIDDQSEAKACATRLAAMR